MLLISLALEPAPTGPRWTTWSEKEARTGATSARAPCSPPTITVSLPTDACAWPPLTGASSIRNPRAADFPASSRTSAGETVLCIMITEPGLRASATPCSPNSTSSAPWASKTQIPTQSTARPSSAGLAATVALVAVKGASDASRRAQRTRSCPRAAIRCAIGSPMLPTPMNPTFIPSPPASLHNRECSLPYGRPRAQGTRSPRAFGAEGGCRQHLFADSHNAQ